MKYFCSVLIIAIAAGVGLAHDFHTTFTTIDHNVSEKQLEISLKLFRHDLEPVLESALKHQVDFGAGEAIDKALLSYIEKRFQISIDDTVFEPKWVGKEVDSQVVFVYLEVPFEGDIQKSKITNSLFFEKFKEQVNYVSITSGEKRSDLVFKSGDTSKDVFAGEK